MTTSDYWGLFILMSFSQCLDSTNYFRSWSREIITSVCVMSRKENRRLPLWRGAPAHHSVQISLIQLTYSFASFVSGYSEAAGDGCRVPLIQSSVPHRPCKLSRRRNGAGRKRSWRFHLLVGILCIGQLRTHSFIPSRVRKHGASHKGINWCRPLSFKSIHFWSNRATDVRVTFSKM